MDNKKGVVYSPRTRESVRTALLRGFVGPKHEICTVAQRGKCDKNRVCIDGPDQGAYPLCRAVVVSVDFAGDTKEEVSDAVAK